ASLANHVRHRFDVRSRQQQLDRDLAIESRIVGRVHATLTASAEVVEHDEAIEQDLRLRPLEQARLEARPRALTLYGIERRESGAANVVDRSLERFVAQRVDGLRSLAGSPRLHPYPRRMCPADARRITKSEERGPRGRLVLIRRHLAARAVAASSR